MTLPAEIDITNADQVREDLLACRHGPLPSSYCTASTLAATGSVHATVTGRPLARMVIPQDRPPPTMRAAMTAISCRNCSTLSV